MCVLAARFAADEAAFFVYSIYSVYYTIVYSFLQHAVLFFCREMYIRRGKVM